MQLAIVIVSYNVQAHLLHCLHSVQGAMQGISGTVWVVDNASSDGSVATVQAHYPEVCVIANPANVGFARACNQAIRASSSDYVLLLNPDTWLAPDALHHLLAYAAAHPQAGAVGPQLLSAHGRYMPESQRQLPTLRNAFGKLFGGNAAAYYQHRHASGPAPVLSGSCMLLRRSALQHTGLLDEAYFMYGEDIDLCKRLLDVGYENHYCATARVVHYKGRSSTRRWPRRLWDFYSAMWRYYRAHVAAAHPRILHFIVLLGILLRGALHGMQQLLRPPAMDTLLALACLLITKAGWEQLVAYPAGGHYPSYFYWTAAPLYMLCWGLGLYLAGAYQQPYATLRVVAGVLVAFICIATLSYLIPAINFSRAIVAISSGLLLLAALSWRWWMQGWHLVHTPQTQAIWVGSPASLPHHLLALHQRLCLGVAINLAQLSNMTQRSVEVWYAADALPAQAVLAHWQQHPPTTPWVRVLHGQALHPTHALGPSQRLAPVRMLEVVLGVVLIVCYPLTFWGYQAGQRAWLAMTGLVRGCYALPRQGVAPQQAVVQAAPADTLPALWTVLRQLPQLGIHLSHIKP